jgi:hypothetical protein
MRNQSLIFFLIIFFVLCIIGACAGSSDSGATDDSSTTDEQTSDDTDSGDSGDGSEDQTGEDHDDPNDYTWDSSQEIPIEFNGSTISADSANVQVDGSIATITSAGNYNLSGDLTDGQIIVDTQDETVVRLILNGVNISNSSSAPIYISNAAKVVINLPENTTNIITDAEDYIFDSEDEEPNAAIYSKANMTIFGEGALTVTGNYNDGIASSDGLIITSGTINVEAADDGIRGKDYLIVKDGIHTITSEGIGLKSDNDDDEEQAYGYVTIENGTLDLITDGDAIAAEKDVLISDGQITIVAGGGSSADPDDSSSTGIRSAESIYIDGGTISIDAIGDALHSNINLEINAGIMDFSSTDDAMHADSSLDINGGDIIIAESLEGLEGATVTINGGELSITSVDDGISVAGGNDDDESDQDDSTDTEGSNAISINGGYVAIDAGGDGIDVNGSFEMTDGTVIVNGPSDSENGPLDYGTFNITGGFIVAVGGSGMAQVAGSSSSTQNGVLINFSSSQPADTLIRVQTSDDDGVLTFAPSKAYESVTFSSPDITLGTTYDVYLGGSCSGIPTNGLYQDGTYSGGTLYTSISISGTVTEEGATGGDNVSYGGRAKAY